MKRTALFCALFAVMNVGHATTKAAPNSTFIMTEHHCDLLQEGTARMVGQNREGMSLEAAKFSIENEYLTGPNKEAYAKIKAYLYAVTEEYYSNHDLAEIDYASVIGRNCRDNIGRTAQ